MTDLRAVALGEAPADLVVEGGRVYLSNRDAILERDVAVVGDRIAALPEDAADHGVVGPDTAVVSAADGIVLPGFVDAHTHADLHAAVERACPYLLESGTTAVVTEASGLGLAFGSSGVEALLDATAALPVSAYVCVPPQGLSDTFTPPRADDGEAEALADLLARDRVVAVGEIDWIHVVGRDSPIERLVDRAEREGKPAVGHGAGCRGDRLAAFATVVDNDHEAVSERGAVDRATQGLHVVARKGSIRDDLDAVVDALDRLDPGSVSLSTDGVWPPDLREGFGMADLVRAAIDRGVDPTTAVDVATRHPAEHFGLSGRGVVAPGAVADLVVVDGFESMAVETVLADGEVVVADGSAREPPTVDYPSFVTDAVAASTDRDRFMAPPSAATDVPDGERAGERVRAMAVDEGLVTRETTVEPAVRDGRLAAAPDRDVLTATLLDRDPAAPDEGFTGFLAGFGMEAGAVATSNTWEIPGLVVVAADADDAAAAAGRVVANGGGWALVRDGEVRVDLPMPIGGAAADRPVPEIAAGLEAVADELRALSVDLERPLLTIQTLSFPGVPALKLSPAGYLDVLDRSLVGFESEESGDGVGDESGVGPGSGA